MAASSVKLRLKDGSREFEGEGSLADIESLLAKVWFGEALKERAGSSKLPPETNIHKPSQSKRSNSNEGADESGFDANEFANKLKNDELFPKIEKNIINPRGKVLNKVTFVLWHANVPLTSGQIHKSLSLLRVKIDLPSISNCLSKNSKNFILSKPRTNGGPPSQYSLSAPALSEFNALIDDFS